MLLVLVFMVALVMLAVMAEAPRVAQQVKRDREEEMVHRGVQYSRAIKRFYRKFGRYPMTIEQLQNTNNVRFLRKQYKDPMVADGKWKLLHPGDVKLASAPNVGTPVSAMGANTQQPTGLTNSQSTSGFSLGPTGLSNPQNPSGLAGSNLGTGLSGLSGPNGPTTTSGSTTTTTGSANPQIVGGLIIGVASVSQAEGIHAYDDKTHYNEWYFIYDATTDRGATITGPYSTKTFAFGNQIPGATPAGSLGQPAGGLGQPMGGTTGFGRPTRP